MAKQKVTIVVDFEVTSCDHLAVHKVTLNGEEVTRSDEEEGFRTHDEAYWPIIELEEDFLDLRFMRV